MYYVFQTCIHIFHFHKTGVLCDVQLKDETITMDKKHKATEQQKMPIPNFKTNLGGSGFVPKCVRNNDNQFLNVGYIVHSNKK